MSPVIQRRNLPSSMINRPPFARYYGVRGTDGDVEDELDENGMIRSFDQIYFEQDADMFNRKKSPQMAHIMKAVIKLSVEQSQKQLQDSNNFGVESLFSNNHVTSEADKKEQKMCPSLNANPHHRHLRKTHGQTTQTSRQRKNMTFTNDEVHTIDRGNHLLLERLIAVNNRKDKHNEPPNRHHTNRQPTAAIKRRKQDEDIRLVNEVQQRRLQDVKPSRSIAKSAGKEDKYQSSFNQHHQSSYNHHHNHQSYHHHHHSSSTRHHKSHHNNSSSHHNTSHNSSSLHHSENLINPLARQWQDS